MLKSLICLSVILLCNLPIIAQPTEGTPAWNVTLKTNTTAPSNLTVQNRCKKKHKFEIRPENVPFLEISKTEVSVKGGKNVSVPVMFDTTDLPSQKYQGQVLVVCKTCQKEPTCTQDREVLPVILTVPGLDNSAVSDKGKDDFVQASRKDKSKDPCEEKCEDLLQASKDKDAAAKTAQDAADSAQQAADKAESAAKSAEEAATDAEAMAKDDIRDDHAIINGDKFTTADTEYRIKLQGEINAAHKAGKISDKEHERQTKANTVRKAREERLKNQAKLKKEAEKARAAADAAREKASNAKTEADKAQKAADDAKKAADDARNVYNDCVRKAKEECDKLKAAEAKRMADAKAYEDAQIAENKRKAAAEKDRQKQIDENKRLLELIKKLGLIDKEIAEVPGIWGWLPDALETPVSGLAEELAGLPIPTDAITAIGGLYGLIGQMLNPCNDALAKPRIIARLNKMGYSDAEALVEIDKMCNLMKKAKAKLQAMSEAQRNLE